MDYKQKVYSLCVMFILLFAVARTPNVQATELIPTTDDSTVGVGSYAVTLPNTLDQTYNIMLGIVRNYASDGTYVNYENAEVYYVQVIDAEGTQNDTLTNYYKFNAIHNNDYNYPELVLSLSDIPAGSQVIVHNIRVEKIEYDKWNAAIWSNYKDTYIATSVTNSNAESKEVVLVEDVDRLKKLVVGESVEQVTKVEEQVDTSFIRETSDTLLTRSGYASYTNEAFLRYLLSSYNVVSLDDIHAIHIVGPIITQNIAERTTENGSVRGYLAASDYSGGIASYIGEFTYYGVEGSEEVGVKFNYKFDFDQTTGFVPPPLYSDEIGMKINVKGDVNHLVDHYRLDEEGDVEVVSTNNSGQTQTFQNDDFIDFSALQTALQSASQEILKTGNAEIYEETIKYEFNTDGTVAGSTITIHDLDGTHTITATNGEVYEGRGFTDFVTQSIQATDTSGGIRLTIHMEESWTVQNADNLQEVNLILPADYDYYGNPYMGPTTINFACAYINPTVYNIDTNGDGVYEQVTHSRMPYTLLNGTEFKETIGENGEYGEVGNKIIWNMPNVVTDSATGDNRLTVLERAHNIAGHIVAPNAEFWNYDINGAWLGGNLNGAAIVKSFYSGIMEMHMWPYAGKAEQAVMVGVQAQKTVNGELPQHEYKFMLDVVRNSEGNIPEGILNNNFPMYAVARIDDAGMIKFSSLAFDQNGTYSFILKEDTTVAKPTDNVVYDLTEYQIDIVVTSETIDDVIIYKVANISKTKVKDSSGNLVSEEITTDLVFNNTTSQEGTVNLNFVKKSTTGHVLIGAKFYITEMTSATDTTRPDGGYFESVVSQEDGYILIENLQKDKYYKIWEYEPAYGHELAQGYWVAYIGTNGFLVSLTSMEGAQQIENNIIYNEPSVLAYLDLTITKKNQMNTLLQGVGFRLQRVVVDAQGVPQVVVNGFDQTYATDENGVFTIQNLEADCVYMLTETTTPIAHVAYTGYWLISVVGNPLRPTEALSYSFMEYDTNNQVIGEVSNDTIYNEKEEFKLPTTGGTGTVNYYLLGTACMLISVILYKKKKMYR